jgi:hypothetical protein
MDENWCVAACTGAWLVHICPESVFF